MYIFYSENFKCILVPIAKSASTSMKQWIYKLDDLKYDPFCDPRGQRSLILSREEFNTRFDDYFTFTCVRNPFARLVSCYLDKFVMALFDKGARMERLYASVEGYQPNIEKMNQLERFAVEQLNASYEQGMTFETFLQAIKTNWTNNPERERSDSHWASQYELGEFEHICYDQVCRLEKLTSSISSIEQTLHIPTNRGFNFFSNRQRTPQQVEDSRYFGNIPAAELSKLSICLHLPEKNFYTLKTVELVHEKFQRDLSYFGYEHLGYVRLRRPLHSRLWQAATRFG